MFGILVSPSENAAFVGLADAGGQYISSGKAISPKFIERKSSDYDV